MLSALCFITFFVGLTTHGLTNWQEAQRALAAREMSLSGNWLYPTINGQPYLAKPPFFYWVQLTLAKVRGEIAGEWELRAAAAIAAWIGVLATYLVGRKLLTERSRADSESFARDAAFFGAGMLATGVLYARSGRIGELDIWLAPLVTVAIGGIAAAWRTHRAATLATAPCGFPCGPEPTAVAPLLIATLAATAAALTKGPPALLAIFVAAYGGIALWAACSPDIPASVPPRRIALGGLLGALVILALTWVLLGSAKDPVVAAQLNHPVGWPLLAGIGAALGILGARVTLRPRALALWRALTRTHFLIVLGVPVVALLAWGRIVGSRIGPAAAAAWANKETEDNLNILVPESPLKNLEAMSYGVGLGSLAAMLALVWIFRRKPRFDPGWYIVVAWLGLGFAAFSILGKGIARYLTPLWPGVALLGGLWVAYRLGLHGRSWLVGRRLRVALGLAFALLGLAQGWWYGFGREQFSGGRSPRALVRELLDSGIQPDRLSTYQYYNSALDYYAGTRVQPIGVTGLRELTQGGKTWDLSDLRADLRLNGPRVMLVRTLPTRRNSGLPIDQLQADGFLLEPIATSARFTIENGRVPMVPVRVSLPDR